MNKTLFKASDVAKMYEVDLKTIHNWVDQGKGPPAYRTPGQHLRFPAAELAAWAAKQEMPFPVALKAYASEKHALGVELHAMIEMMSVEQRKALVGFAAKVSAA